MSKKEYDGPVRVGQLRPSQLLYSFGAGALIDLPHLSVIVGGLDQWEEARCTELTEERLLAAVRQFPGMREVRRLRQPPWIAETMSPFDEWTRVGVPVSPFPRWLRCPWGGCQYLGPIDDGQWAKDMSNPYRLDRHAYRHDNCRKKGRGATGLPVRFMLACGRGHLDEFPFVDFVHKRNVCDKPLLEMSERGLSTGPADVFVSCRSCDASMPMSQAFGEAGERNLPGCRGRHPHLGRYDPNGCGAAVRTLLLGASNLWFGVTRSVLSIPAGEDPVHNVVDGLWAELERISERAILDYALLNNDKLSRLANFSNDEVWAAIERRHGEGTTHDEREGDEDDKVISVDVLTPEWNQFTHVDDAPDTEDFRIREVEVPEAFEDQIERVVCAERLREVLAFMGFTRLSAPDSDEPNQEIAPITKNAPTWVPATEVRGEGVFIQLKENAVGAWADQFTETDKYQQLLDAHRNWRSRRNMDGVSGWPGARYVLLHTLSHVLMREFALDCGYSAASIRERIYSKATGDEPMAGILLYTAAPDSEGTLGGLVSLGHPDRFERLLRQALRHAEICTSDPTCAEHEPGSLGDDHLHAAACHACLFASETSCEKGNRYLDRSVLVPTVAGASVPFFTGGDGNQASVIATRES